MSSQTGTAPTQRFALCEREKCTSLSCKCALWAGREERPNAEELKRSAVFGGDIWAMCTLFGACGVEGSAMENAMGGEQCSERDLSHSPLTPLLPDKHSPCVCAKRSPVFSSESSLSAFHWSFFLQALELWGWSRKGPLELKWFLYGLFEGTCGFLLNGKRCCVL